MAAKVERLHQPPPARDILSDCIGQHSLAVENVARVNAAHADAEAKVYAAADALKNAEVQRDEALACEGANLAAAALGEPTGLSVADAAAAVTEARVAHAAARSTRDALAARSQREAAEVEKSERSLNDAVVGVFRSEAPIASMLERAQDLQRRLIDMRLQLRFLQKTNCVAEADMAAVRNFLLNTALPSGTGGNEFGNWSGAHAATAVWLSAAADLKANASAKLPKV